MMMLKGNLKNNNNHDLLKGNSKNNNNRDLYTAVKGTDVKRFY